MNLEHGQHFFSESASVSSAIFILQKAHLAVSVFSAVPGLFDGAANKTLTCTEEEAEQT